MTRMKCFVVALVFSLTSFLAAAGNLAECSPSDDREVVIKASQNFKELKSYHVSLDLRASLAIQGRSFDVITSGEADVNAKPLLMKMTLSSIAPNGTRTVEQYIEEDGGRFFAYSYVNKQWVKQSLPAYNPMSNYDGYFKEIKSVRAIRHFGVYGVYEVVIDGKYMKEALERGMASATAQKLKLPEGFYSNLGDFKYIVTIDKRTSHLTRMEMDMSELLASVGTSMADLQEIPEADKEKFRVLFQNMKMTMTMTVSRFNSADKVSIPPEVRVGAMLKDAGTPVE